MGQCLNLGSGGDSADSKGSKADKAKKGARKAGEPAAEPPARWSWDTQIARKWKRPGKDDFFRRFQRDGEEGLGPARERYVEGTVPGRETKGVVGTADKRETRVWRPGDLDGYELCLEGLKHVDYYVADFSGQMTLDDCEDCRVFIAPCGGSVFIRNCKGCRFAVCCSQLRMRDCADCALMVYVPGRVNVESCKRTSLACWNISYFELADQMAKAQLSAFNNAWWRVHDFGTNSVCTQLEPGTSPQELFGEDWAGPGAAAGLGSFAPATAAADAACVPVVTGWDGAEPEEGEQLTFALFAPGRPDAAAAVCARASAAGLAVAATREVPIALGGEDAARQLFGPKGVPGCGGPAGERRRKSFCNGPAVGVVLSAARSAVLPLLREQRLSVLDGSPPEDPENFAQGQVCVWEGAAATAPALYFLTTIHHSLDG
eukprot:TRINITY_DN16039_c0_g1_i1.p1 TRINITY_DN16039_c0_g1~~TRINITY_DN16039_c0_g1_i1.p1  ORF type:complete len:458 (+),score=138.14 TRINITY_DN16039_c0_g1_i1:83-1375(+)